MYKNHLILALIIASVSLISCHNKSSNNLVDNNIDTITTSQLRQWQDDKIGMFIHWGLYSIPAGIWNGEKVPYYAEQIMNHARIPVAEYEQLAKQFNPTQWNSDSIVKLAKDAGMKYIVFTSKHHDGFCMFKTNTTDYNVVDATPFGRDVVAELSESCKKYGIKLGLYYSFPDWHYPGSIPRIERDTTTNCTEYVNQLYSPLEAITPELEDYIVNQLSELLTNYGDIYTIWFDMGIVTPEQSKRFKETVKSLQPHCLISGRIMNNEGDYMTLPDNGDIAGYSDVAWDNPASMYGTWGYRSWQNRIDANLQCNRQLMRLMKTISHGGVFLLNIGPTGDGNVIDYEKTVLNYFGYWVSTNKEAIYSTSASPFDKLDNACCTKKDNKLYITVFDTVQHVNCQNIISKIEKAYLLDEPDINVNYTSVNGSIDIEVPPILLLRSSQRRPIVIVLEFTGNDIITDHVYIRSDENNVFYLTNENAVTHAAFDSKSYMTTQSDSWKSWYIDVELKSDYDIFAVYLPENDDKSYTISCGNDRITHVFPGVDRMIQTTYVGKIHLNSGRGELKLESTANCTPLEALGLDIKQIILRPKK